MQNQPLLLSSLLQHAKRFHGSTEIVSRTVEGPIHRYTYKDAARRARTLADALRRWGVGPGDRVATLAWNNYRHFEIEHGVTGLGAVWHAINPRLIAAQISYIANHAEDKVVFFESSFLPMVEKLALELPTVGLFVLMVERTAMPATSISSGRCSMSCRPPRCSIRRARPVTRKACSTRTVPTCCIASPSAAPIP